jgi:hypothetical protein
MLELISSTNKTRRAVISRIARSSGEIFRRNAQGTSAIKTINSCRNELSSRHAAMNPSMELRSAKKTRVTPVRLRTPCFDVVSTVMAIRMQLRIPQDRTAAAGIPRLLHVDTVSVSGWFLHRFITIFSQLEFLFVMLGGEHTSWFVQLKWQSNRTNRHGPKNK